MENPHSDLALCKLLGIKYPIIMAPMFLVSNEKMLIAASKKGIAGAIPALNYRTVEELRAGIRTIKAEATGPIGINLIVNASNFLMDEQLQVCCDEKVVIFIASEEADVSQEYKQACVDFGAKDIVTTTKLSGTPCTVIRTPYVKEIGTKQNWLERLLNKNKRIKKWVKAIVFYRGMQSLKRAAFGATYKTVWCAGPSIEHVHGIRSVSQIVDELLNDGKA